MPDDRPLVLRANELAAAMEGQVVTGPTNTAIGGFSIDSRQMKTGDLFIAIRGSQFDGHQFVSEAVRKGAGGIVVSDVSAVPDATGSPEPFAIAVRDTTKALQLLARFVRRESGARVVAITGSIGKTTTKEIAAALLSSKYKVFRSEGNLNNHIGLPLSLLALHRSPEVAVVELGMNHVGEIHTLVGIAEPEIRVWTNVAEVHAAFFDSIDEIADAKAEIMDAATQDTELVANGADPHVMSRIAGFPGRVTTFAVDAQADVRATDVRGLGLDGMEATIHTPVGSAPLRTSLLGQGNMANVLAAVAVALRFQVPLHVLLSRVPELTPQPRRGQVIRVGGVTIVDDSYNSNPTALRRVLEAVTSDNRCTRRIAVLGEMLELGARTNEMHEACGRAVAMAGFDLVIAVGGEPAKALAQGALAEGLPAAVVVTCSTSDEASDQAHRLVRPGDLVLVKGSRGIGTDRVVDRLRAELG